MSKSSDLDKVVKAYIIDCINGEPYGKELETDKDKVLFLRECLNSEYGHMVKRVGEHKALAEYYAGLPSICTLAFYNTDILNLAVLWGSLPENYTEKQAFKILDNWFSFVANKTTQLFRKHSKGELI